MKTGRTRPPTMKDVAELAGVGLKTVSRHVNGETNINPELASRIQDAISQLGYTRNLAAASIRPGWTSKMVGLVISDLADPFYSGIASAIEKELAREDYILILANSFDLGESLDEVVQRLVEQRVEGLILVPPSTPSRVLEEPGCLDVPTVLLDRPVPGSGLNAVVADNYTGALKAGQLLRKEGFSRPAFLGDSLSVYTMGERYRGLCAAFGVDPEGPDALPGWFSAHTKQQAAEGALALIEDLKPDCIFAANNRASIGALEAFQASGIWLPLIGFDDFENASLIMGGLSVVAQDIQGTGTEAAKLLLKQIKGGSVRPEEMIQAVQLIVRGSEKANWRSR